jgi:hypothetical protein
MLEKRERRKDAMYVVYKCICNVMYIHKSTQRKKSKQSEKKEMGG